MSSPIITEIVDAVQNDRAVFVIGSGMSAIAGLPTSVQLANQLNKKFKLDLKSPERDNLQFVAKFVEIRHDRNQLVNALSAILQFSGKIPSAHELLVKIAKKIVTTNYDTVIEQTIRSMRLPRRFRIIKRPTDCSNLTPPTLIKTHGCIEEKKTLVVTLDDYIKRISERDLLHAVLKIWYASNDLILLGYSARDMDFLLLLYEIRKELGPFAGKVFVVLKDSDKELSEILQSWNFRLVPKDVRPFLKELVKEWERKTEVKASKTSLTFGGFRVDFGVLVGNVDKSLYRPGQIRVRRADKKFIPSKPVKNLVPKYWTILSKRAAVHGRILTNDSLARLCGYSYSKTKHIITLHLQPTSYRYFVTTNLLLDLPIVPVRKKGNFISIRELAGSEVFSFPSPYLANPLNVIAMLVTRDKFTFIAKRSASVYERPNTWQASVGGALRKEETPAEALIREVEEEWGVEIKESEIRFFALGVNQKTGEPDLIGMIETRFNLREVIDNFAKHSQQLEFPNFETFELTERSLKSVASALRFDEWSQPSDQTAVLITLIRQFGMAKVKKAFRELGA